MGSSPEPADERPRLDLLIKDAGQRAPGGSAFRPRISLAGSCPRSLVYSMRGYPRKEREPHVPLLLADGHHHEDISCGWLEKAGLPVGHRQHGVDLALIPDASPSLLDCESCGAYIPSNAIHGHIDGIIGDRWLFEHKGLGDNAYRRLQYEAPENYVQQCCCYLLGLERMGAFSLDGALLLIKAKNTSDYTQLWISYDHHADCALVTNETTARVFEFANVVGSVVDLLTDAHSYRVGEDFPERPYHVTDWHCKFCDFLPSCWRPEDLHTQGGVVLDVDDPLLESGWQFHDGAMRKKELDGDVSELRGGVLREMHDRGIESFTDGSLVIRIKRLNRGKGSYEVLDSAVI